MAATGPAVSTAAAKECELSMRVDRIIVVLPKVLAAAIIAITLSGCMTSAMEVPKPQPREEPINSLALEQCIRENGQAQCTGG